LNEVNGISFYLSPFSFELSPYFAFTFYLSAFSFELSAKFYTQKISESAKTR